MKVDFKKIIVKDINNEIVKDEKFHKKIANIIYNFAENLDMVEIARDINQGKEVELRTNEIDNLIHLFTTSKLLMSFTKKAIKDFLD